MPAAPPSTLSKTTLPTELVQRIIRLALPPPTFTRYKERYAILLQLCRVSRMWRALGQQELFAHAWIRTARDAGVFMEAQERIETATGAWTTPQSLWIDAREASSGMAIAWSNSRLSLLFEACTGMKTISIVSRTAAGPLSPCYALDSVAKGLVELTMDHVRISQSAAVEFTSLRRLILRYSLLSELGILDPRRFPHLESLTVVVREGGAVNISHQVGRLQEHMAALAPQLRALCLWVSLPDVDDDRDLLDELPTTFWECFQNLDRLVIDFDRHQILRHLSSPLQYLRLRSGATRLGSVQPLIDLFNEAHPSLAKLGTLDIPSDPSCTTDPSSCGVAPESLAELAERASLRTLCKERTIKLLETKAFESNSSLTSLGDAKKV